MNDQSLAQHYLADALQTFRDYKKLAERAFAQISDEDFFATLDDESNSIAVNMKHMAGNMLSRWTDFLTTDGEKPERDRDIEFVMLPGTTKDDMIAYWDRGWKCVFDAIEPLKPEDLMRKIRSPWRGSHRGAGYQPANRTLWVSCGSDCLSLKAFQSQRLAELKCPAQPVRRVQRPEDEGVGEASADYADFTD